MKCARYSPRFFITRATHDGKLGGFWFTEIEIESGEPKEPSFLKNLENWFEWCRWKCEKQLKGGV